MGKAKLYSSLLFSVHEREVSMSNGIKWKRKRKMLEMTTLFYGVLLGLLGVLHFRVFLFVFLHFSYCTSILKY